MKLHSLTANLYKVSATCLLMLLSSQVSAHGSSIQPADKPHNPLHDNRKISFPDTAQYKTLVVDLHTHSVFSDGHVWPKIRVDEALKDGLDAMAVTEHLEWQPHLFDIPHPDRNRAIEIASDAAKDTSLIIIAGSEITRQPPAGHINAVFIEDANSLLKVDEAPDNPKDTRAYYAKANEWPAQAAVDVANQQGAFVFWNHPYWTVQSPNGIATMNDFHKSNIEAGKVHGVEIANGGTYSEEAHAIALEFNLALIGVSDVHDLIDWDYDPATGSHRPVTLVLATEKTGQAIEDALFAKRTVVWFRNLLIGRANELNSLINASLSIVDAKYQENTQVMNITIRNISDADFKLRNRSEYTFMQYADNLTVPAHSSIEVSVKPGKRLDSIALEFSVENALVAPKEHPNITLIAQPD